MHKVAARHLAGIQSGKIDRGTIIGLRKMISSSFRAGHGYSVGRGQAKAPLEDVDTVLDAVTKHKPIAVGELHGNGLKVLRSRRNRKALEGVANIAASVTGFRLVGYEFQGRLGDYFVPIWRAETADGRFFDFLNIPWQSGGNGPEVVNTSY